MTTPQRHPLVESAAFVAMEADAILEAIRAHGFELREIGPRLVAGTRAIPGHPETECREVRFVRGYGYLAWSGALYHRHPHPQAGALTGSKLTAPGARYPSYTGRLLQHAQVRTLDELETWLGGAVSVPVDDRERDAIHKGGL